MTKTTKTPPSPAPPRGASQPPPQAASALRPRRSLNAWLRDRSKAELAIWIGLIVVAFALRMYDLGARPFHHDESQDAFFSYTFFKSGDYSYNPLLHGPLRFYLTGLSYLLFGDSNVTARLAPVLMGTLATGLPYLLRNQIGRLAAFGAGVMLAFGPTYLYFSRFAREDIYFAAITLAMLVAILRYLDRPTAYGPSIIAGLLALSFATKETSFISLAVGVSYFAVALVVQGVLARRRGARFADGHVATAIRSADWVTWVYALATFWIVFALMFTVFFTQPDGLWKGIHDGLAYWLDQQPVNRGGERWYFYLAVLFGEEWPVLVLGAVGAFFSLRRPTTGRLFLLWWFVGSLAIYSWASERFAWLALHPLLPLILLAGIGLQGLWRLRSRVARSIAVAGIVLCAAYMAYASYLVNAVHSANPREWLVSTQSSVEVRDVAARVDRLDRAFHAAHGGTKLTITIDSGQGATFPYAWYFRHKSVGYIDMTTPNYQPTTQVLIMTEQARAALLPNLAAYDGQKFHFRVWWVRDWSKKLSASAWWKWFTKRQTWNPTGGMEEWIYVRKVAGAL